MFHIHEPKKRGGKEAGREYLSTLGMQMLQKLVLIKHLKEQMEDGDESEASLDKRASRTHLGQLPLGVERHQDEDVGHCGRYTTQVSSAR